MNHNIKSPVELVEELWDKYSQQIGDRLYDLEEFSGKDVILRADFLQAIQTYHDQFADEWIKVEDRLPENGDEVIVCVNGKSKISTFRINNGVKSFYCGSDNSLHYGKEYITHWQPLPAKPIETKD